MSVSLTLYFPLRREIPTAEPIFAGDRLHLTLDDGARPYVDTWTVWELPGPLQILDEEQGLCMTDIDPYGEPLTWTLVAEIDRHPVPQPDEVLPWTHAVFEFLGALPPEQIVVLHWE